MEQVILHGLSAEQLLQLFGDVVSEKVDEAIKKSKEEDLLERFLSVEETRRLFSPPISRQCLHNWTEKGILNKHVIAGKVLYKYSQVLEAVKTVKRFKRSD